MITRIQALNFRCLQYVAQPVGAFHVLTGANASGKTTFLDILAFIRDLVTPHNDLRRRYRSAQEISGNCCGIIRVSLLNWH